MVVAFKGLQFPKMSSCMRFFSCTIPTSFRELQVILTERGIIVDHPTLNRWVVRYFPRVAAQTRIRKRTTARS